MDEIKVKLNEIKIGDILIWEKGNHSWTIGREKLLGFVIRINENKILHQTKIEILFSQKVLNRTHNSFFIFFDRNKNDIFFGKVVR